MQRTLVGFALLLLLVGCGGGDVSADPVAAAATKTADAGSSRVSFVGTMALVETGGEAVRFTGEGVFDYSARRGRLEYDLSDLVEAAGGPTGLEIKAEFLWLGLDFYMRMPFLTQDRPRAKPWVKLDLVKSEAAASELMAVGGWDPARTLEFLRASSGRITEVGEEPVRGVATTHYRAQIDFERAIEQVSEDVRPILRKQMRAYERRTGRKGFPLEVWVDDEGLARRIRMDDPAGTLERVTMTTDLYDFGVGVNVEPPPADQVMSEKELDAMLEEDE